MVSTAAKWGYTFLAIVVLAVLGLAVYMVLWGPNRKHSGNLKGLQPVTVDWTAYLGLWYEHRRINSWFEPADLYAVTATYNQLETKIEVINSGTRFESSEVKTSKGNAVITDAPGVLNVSFFPGVGGQYVVIGLRDGYSIVASPSRDNLWLLGRAKEAPSDEILTWFAGVSTTNGFDLSRVVPVPQTRPATTNGA